MYEVLVWGFDRWWCVSIIRLRFKIHDQIMGIEGQCESNGCEWCDFFRVENKIPPNWGPSAHIGNLYSGSLYRVLIWGAKTKKSKNNNNIFSGMPRLW